ncbi:MAG: hypothetical protein AAB113_01120, partial [Candidatus Eisenbacteria bacterium]
MDLATLMPPNATGSLLEVTLRATGASVDPDMTLTLRVTPAVNYKVWAITARADATATNNSVTSDVEIPNISQRIFYLVGGSGTPNTDMQVFGYRLPNGG